MRILALVFVVLILLLQYPAWLGKGGWLQVRELGRQVDRQKAINTELKARNEVLEAEVRDLKQGVDAVEERARSELGMVKKGEVFFMLQDVQPPAGAATSPPGQPGALPTTSPVASPKGPAGSGPIAPAGAPPAPTGPRPIVPSPFSPTRPAGSDPVAPAGAAPKAR